MDNAEDWDENHHEEEEKEGEEDEVLRNPLECFRDEVDVDKAKKLGYLHVPLDLYHLICRFIRMVFRSWAGAVADEQVHQYVAYSWANWLMGDWEKN